MTAQNFTVTGMTCGHCVAAVTEEIAKIDGVADVAVDLDTGLVAVVGAGYTDAQVRAAVDEAGYAVTA